jgi:hypothetical protein
MGTGGDIYATELVERVEGAIARAEFFVDQFSPEGSLVGRLSDTPEGPFPKVKSFAVDPESGSVFAANFIESTNVGLVDVFGPDVVIPDVAVSEPVSGFHSEPATHTWGVALRGTVNPDEAGAATCEFEYGLTASLGGRAACEAGVPSGNAPVEVQSEEITGLPADTEFRYRLDATNVADGHTNTGAGAEDEGSFTTPGPGVLSESVAELASTSVTLQAVVDPNQGATSSFFEYSKTSTDTCTPATCTDAPTPPGTGIGAGKGGVTVGEHVQGLAPSSVYHYRVVAVSGGVQYPGVDHTFTTQAAHGGGLPDGRAWELVSPPDKHGALISKIGTEGGGLIQAAANGNAITYVTDAPTEADVKGYDNKVQILSARGTNGWSTRNIAVPHLTATGFAFGATIGSEYRVFSEDLSSGVVQPFGGFDPAVTPEASEQTPYQRHNFSTGSICPTPAQEAQGASCYRPLLTGKPPFTDVTSGLPFSTTGECPTEPTGETRVICAPEIVSATPDAKHVLLRTLLNSAKGGLAALTGFSGDEGGLYEWSAGGPAAQQLALVSVLPDNTDASEVRHGAVSEEGSLVFFGHAGRLYMRDVPLEETVQIGGVGANFEAAFASDGHSLVLAAGQLCEVVVNGGGELECPGVAGGTAPGASLLGASRDGSVLYFASGEVLTGSTPNSRGEVAQSGQSNLYVRDHGVVELIAVLAPGHTGNSLASHEGGQFAFMSDLSLTGYDNRDAQTGTPDSEIYLYSLSSGGLVCVSCDPSGARPTGPSSVPGLTPAAESFALYQSRYLTDSGRVFFDSNDALVPQDVNGSEDVYEWEPAGIPSGSTHACSSSTPGYSASTGGCIGLISSGSSAEDSTFLDASESGGDVFFLTTAKLSALQDTDTSPDIYDAHECTSAFPCLPAPAAQSSTCTTPDACRAAPTPQPEIFGAPSSSTFTGPGNSPATPPPATKTNPTPAQRLRAALKACRAKHKHNRHKRTACETAARKRYPLARKASRHTQTQHP